MTAMDDKVNAIIKRDIEYRLTVHDEEPILLALHRAVEFGAGWEEFELYCSRLRFLQLIGRVPCCRSLDEIEEHFNSYFDRQLLI